MKTLKVGLFLPFESVFYRRLFNFMKSAFEQHHCQVQGKCGLLGENEMAEWVEQFRPDFIFEMNRVKDDIPVLHEKNIFHITWIVDFQGRDESKITGSDITYFFDPGWDINYKTKGFQDWLPPGTCVKSFFPVQNNKAYQFGFLGHIPKPWTKEELKRKLFPFNDEFTFEILFNEYQNRLCEYEIATHNDLIKIIERIVVDFIGENIKLPKNIYYDLMERSKRLRNRQDLIDRVLTVSDNIVIYGSENWSQWDKYKNYYRGFISKTKEINDFCQSVDYNLHDGLGFHFRSIDCLAAGGILFHHNIEKTGNPKKKNRGLFDFFDKELHYYEFLNDLESVCDKAASNRHRKRSVQEEVRMIIKNKHTWNKRIQKITEDFLRIK